MYNHQHTGVKTERKSTHRLLERSQIIILANKVAHKEVQTNYTFIFNFPIVMFTLCC